MRRREDWGLGEEEEEEAFFVVLLVRESAVRNFRTMSMNLVRLKGIVLRICRYVVYMTVRSKVAMALKMMSGRVWMPALRLRLLAPIHLSAAHHQHCHLIPSLHNPSMKLGLIFAKS